MEPVYSDGKNNQFSIIFDIIFSKIFYECSVRLLLMIQLALVAKTANFKGQTNPRAIYHLFGDPNTDFTIFSGDPEFQSHSCQNFSWTFVKTLVMEPVGTNG
ncbi:hypothetical protein H5410_052981 [Solanum commersonii]|uniref:Uncharacterized protein n=1 Tax=Solanum commersonii TaxID=4109 RepID=A0A9J5X326_SOLCO|nr:hypothetical protein H5410_052981 [Solanum commersonii]